MSGKVPASLRYPNNRRCSSLLSPSSQAQYLVGTCPCETAFTFRWRVFPQSCFYSVAQYTPTTICKRIGWPIRSSIDGNGLNSPPSNGTSGRTRLARAIQALLANLNARFQEIRSGFFMKTLSFLVGFYCATAFSTVIGQTGDWDILSAGLAVIVVEGIGALMYKPSLPLLKSLITLFNFWKAGLSMGLFLDAFKY